MPKPKKSISRRVYDIVTKRKKKEEKPKPKNVLKQARGKRNKAKKAKRA